MLPMFVINLCVAVINLSAHTLVNNVCAGISLMAAAVFITLYLTDEKGG